MSHPLVRDPDHLCFHTDGGIADGQRGYLVCFGLPGCRHEGTLQTEVFQSASAAQVLKLQDSFGMQGQSGEISFLVAHLLSFSLKARFFRN